MVEMEQNEALEQEELKVCQKALTKGFQWNFRKMSEECGELLSALSKYIDDRATKEEVITELADVSLIITAFASYFGYEDFLSEKERKLQRLKERLNH